MSTGLTAEAYRKKVYGGLLGKCAGVRLGAPVEPTIWSYERIRTTYGDITDYVKDYKNFAADDDVNGPMFFIRALIDHEGEMSAEAVGRTWIDYTREGLGFFWWGGYGRSTEHTAYLNIAAGLQPPASGSAYVNGYTLAEQIGGQIFIDSWGWVSPGNPDQAARFARMAASVSHDRNGIYGGIFIAVCIALAFDQEDIEKIIELALEYIPADSEYTRVVTAVRDFYYNDPVQEHWRDAHDMLTAEFGYDRYPGVCHMIPNAGVCALALYYGEGDLARTIEIATMCGWDTDCNAGNVGAILGVMNGPEGVPERYRRPIGDVHVASSIAGALNIINLPNAATELAILGSRLAQQETPESWSRGAFSDDLFLDFSLPGGTAGLRTSSDFLAPIAAGEEYWKEGGTAVILDRLVRGATARVFYKPYYRRDDFDDERYSPTFTPTVYPGQTLKVSGYLEKMSGQKIGLAPYVRDGINRDIVESAYTFIGDSGEFSFEYILPEVPFAIDEVGVLATNFDSEKYLGKLVITEFSVRGKRSFKIVFTDEQKEFKGLTRCSVSGGAFEIEDESLHMITTDTSELYSGPYYGKNYICSTKCIPEYGESHLIIFRARGAASGYLFGFTENGTVSLYRRDREVTILEQIPFSWEIGRKYTLEVACSGDEFSCRIDGKEIIVYRDEHAYPYGMAGVGKLGAGRTRFLTLSYEEV